MQQCNCPECERARIVNAGGGLHGSFLLVEPDKRIDFQLVVRMEDEPVHTEDHPFCDDWYCPCHHDWSEAATARFRETIEQPLEDGLLTNAESQLLYHGITI